MAKTFKCPHCGALYEIITDEKTVSPEEMLCSSHAAAASSLVQRKVVPSTQMRCMMTANRRASATIAFFSPRCLAIFIAQALSHDHLTVRVSML